MAFDRLRQLPPMLHSGAQDYARQVLNASRAASQAAGFVGDLAYGADPWQTLDIYAPASFGQAPMAVLLSFHGGAWMNGYKEWMGFQAPALAHIPLILVTPDYRLAPAVGMAEIVDDCYAALAWTYSNIARFGGDPARIWVGGHSAGAHLAAVLALRPDLAERHGLPADVVRGAALISAPLALDFLHAPATQADHKLAQALGAGAAQWSPLRLAEQAAVPFCLDWGEHDFPRIVEQNRAFVARLQARGLSVSGREWAGHDHFSVHVACGQPGSAWAQQFTHYF